MWQGRERRTTVLVALFPSLKHTVSRISLLASGYTYSMRLNCSWWLRMAHNWVHEWCDHVQKKKGRETEVQVFEDITQRTTQRPHFFRSRVECSMKRTALLRSKVEETSPNPERHVILAATLRLHVFVPPYFTLTVLPFEALPSFSLTLY